MFFCNFPFCYINRSGFIIHFFVLPILVSYIISPIKRCSIENLFFSFQFVDNYSTHRILFNLYFLDLVSNLNHIDKVSLVFIIKRFDTIFAKYLFFSIYYCLKYVRYYYYVLPHQICYPYLRS